MHRILHVGWRESSFVVRFLECLVGVVPQVAVEAIEVNPATDIIQTAQPLTDRAGKGRTEMNTYG